MNKRLSFFQRHGVTVYGVLAAIALVTTWALAGYQTGEFGVEAVRTWAALSVAVLFATMSVKASEVRRYRDRGRD